MGHLINIDNVVDNNIKYSDIIILVITLYREKMSEEAKKELLSIYYNYLLSNINQEVISLNTSKSLLTYLRENKPDILKQKVKIK